MSEGKNEHSKGYWKTTKIFHTVVPSGDILDTLSLIILKTEKFFLGDAFVSLLQNIMKKGIILDV